MSLLRDQRVSLIAHENESPARPKSKSHVRSKSQSLTGHESESPMGPKNARETLTSSDDRCRFPAGVCWSEGGSFAILADAREIESLLAHDSIG